MSKIKTPKTIEQNVEEGDVVGKLFGSLRSSKRGYVPYSVARKEAGKLLGKKYGLSK